MAGFKALRLFDEAGKTTCRIVEATLDELDPGEVVIHAAYSSINYKDALAGTGTGKVVRRFPLIGGIDVAGTVVSSSVRDFRAGDAVICTSYDLGVAHDGGYAEYVRVPAAWVVPLPDGLTLEESMGLGTAGYTAALAVELMQQNDLRPGTGKVAVNGATGGVASLAIEMLAGLGFEVAAITGKDSEHDYLKQLGAAEVISRHTLEMGKKPLENMLWAGAVDSLGGEPLAWLTRTMGLHGVIASIGNAAGFELHTTVFPFILRGVRLIGVDSVNTEMPLRRRIWQRLATDLKPKHLQSVVQTIGLDQVPSAFGRLMRGEVRGRFLVKLRD
jgi:putative YhdH/YhfP family quinone oxidoreductase